MNKVGRFSGGGAFTLLYPHFKSFNIFMFTTALLSVHLATKLCQKLYEWCKYMLHSKLFPSVVVCSKHRYPSPATVESFVHEIDGVQMQSLHCNIYTRYTVLSAHTRDAKIQLNNIRIYRARARPFYRYELNQEYPFLIFLFFSHTQNDKTI